MKKITKYFGIGLLGLALSTVASCSDDDDNCNGEHSSSIVYQDHAFSKAYTKEEGKAFLAEQMKGMFSPNAIDTAKLSLFIKDCYYFNKTYLEYRGSSSNLPFDSLVGNVMGIMSGDLSGVSAAMNSYKKMAGEYTANAATKMWDKVGDKKYRIVLNFKDKAGVDIKASLAWLTAGDGMPAGAEGDMMDLKPNIINVTDIQGHVLSDTLPNKVELIIKGGKNNIDFGAMITLAVLDGKMVILTAGTYLGEMGTTTVMNIHDETEERTTKILNKSKTLAVFNTKIRGNNLIKSLVDYKNYPPTERTKYKDYVINDKVVISRHSNEVLVAEKFKELLKAGYWCRFKNEVQK